jgi:hypothetical protein
LPKYDVELLSVPGSEAGVGSMVVGEDERDIEWMDGREGLADELLPLLVSHRWGGG